MNEYADLEGMAAWAASVMTREPDFIVGENYLRRWFIVPRNAQMNVYLHEFRRSDDDRAMHDHPWNNRSFIIAGQYIEHTPQGRILRQPGDCAVRLATDRHRVELINGAPCVTLFTTGPKIRDWGFHCPQGFVPWQEFTDPTNYGNVGRGCGEPS